MEHFSVIQSLCRAGLDTGDDRVRRQVERLRDRLNKAGDERDVAALDRLLAAKSDEGTLAPSVVQVSRALVQGDELTANVPAPVDRETSVPLAELILEPGRGLPTPIHNETLTLALNALLGEWGKVEALRAMGVEPSRSCLFYGPPGTGKTLTALTVAQRLQLPVVNARIDGLVSSFLGTTARNIANLFDFANRYRCVLLLDEFDAMAKMRDDPHELGEIKRVVNTLLQNLDARKGIGLTIAITNHEGLLDSAVWRRFENHIRVELPDLPTRLDMLQAFLAPVPIDLDVVKTLAFVIGQRSGSDLRTFTEMLKRSLAMQGDALSPPTVLAATKALLPRLGLGYEQGSPAHLLIHDQTAFIGAALHESGLGIKQDRLGQMLNCSQSKISRAAADWVPRHAGSPSEEAPHGQ
jgi:ATPase family protein associated with various cellular activities (AAA)